MREGQPGHGRYEGERRKCQVPVAMAVRKGQVPVALAVRKGQVPVALLVT